MRIGIDLGGTKIEGVALDEAGHELARKRVPTPHDSYETTLAALAELVAWLERHTGQRGSVGVAHPGAISPATGLIKNSNSTRLIGHKLDQDLAKILQRPVRLANDANCFAVSEAVDGAARGLPTVFGVILGTGVGGGLVIDGKPLGGANAIAGEWGHNPLPAPQPGELPGPRCYCGRSGCIETWVSGVGLARDHALRQGGAKSAADIVAAAQRGEPGAEQSLQLYCDRLARALGDVINLFDPHAIVLGGGMSNCTELYRQVPHLWGKYIFSDRVETKLLPPHHGDSSGVRGAAWLWAAGEKP